MAFVMNVESKLVLRDSWRSQLTAEQCISCKEESEIQEKSNIFDRRSKSLGKSLQEMSVR